MKAFKFISFISLILFSFSSKATFRKTTDAHFFKGNSNLSDSIQLFNKLSSSFSYGLWTNQILNGSGNKAFFNPLKNEIESQRLLRTFSLFDLALTNEMKKWEPPSHY